MGLKNSEITHIKSDENCTKHGFVKAARHMYRVILYNLEGGVGGGGGRPQDPHSYT